MNVTIRDGYEDKVCYMDITGGSADIREAWRTKYGSGALPVYKRSLFKMMMDISNWANNELGVECTFDCE